jgi:hypothetical protein
LLYAAEESDVIVNLPAGVHKLVGEWFKIGRIQEQAEDTGAKLYLWYVCDGDITNLRLYGESQGKIPIQHIFVKNMVRLDEDEWEVAIDSCKNMGIDLGLENMVKVTIGKLGYWEAQALSQTYQSFESIQDIDFKGLGRIEKNTIRYFLNDCLREIDNVMRDKVFESGGLLVKMTPKEEYEREYEERYQRGEYDEIVERDETGKETDKGSVGTSNKRRGGRKKKEEANQKLDYEYVVMIGEQEYKFENETEAREYLLSQEEGLREKGEDDLEKILKDRINKRTKIQG